MKNKINIFTTALLAIILTSCSDDSLLEPHSSTNTSPQIESISIEGIIPFTVENVRNALPTVLSYYRSTKPEVMKRFTEYQVNTTHIYYKFIPNDSIQYSQLMEFEDALQFTTTPFEYTPIEKTTDPEESEMPIFYAVADVNSKIPDIPHEIIAELHFTDEDKLEDLFENYDEIEFKQNLMYETRKIARHLDKEELAEGYMNYREGIDTNSNANSDNKTTFGLFSKKWRPSGKVLVEEDIVHSNYANRRHNEPVRRARVNVLKWGWLQIEHGTTDLNGDFSTGTTYTKQVHYKVKFKHDYVTIKDGNFYNTADYFSGKHKKQALKITFLRDGGLTRYHFFALVHNASYDYYKNAIGKFGLQNPGNLNITTRYYGSGSESGAQWYPFNSAIRVSRSSSGIYRGSDGIYATTVHELTHSGHRKKDPGMFSIFESTSKTRLLMIESWAEGVETILTNQRYTTMYALNGHGTYRGTTRGTHNLTQGWNGKRQLDLVATMNKYTPLVIDLVDNVNQNTLNTLNNLPIDRVSGYTLNQIQGALKDSRTISDWRNKLVNNYNNSTEGFVDDVFGYAQFVRDNNL